MVVSIDELNCLDCLLWLGEGRAAADKICVAQSTLSRNARAAAAKLYVSLLKRDAEWHVSGDHQILSSERLLHQQIRWARNLPLRLDAQFYSGPFLADGLSQTQFLLGNFDLLDTRKPFALLRAGVLDAWIAGYPDVPDPEDEDLACFRLTRLPLKLAVSTSHPLLQKGDGLCLDDVAAYPCMALPDGAFPRIEQILKGLGLWNSPIRMRRYDPAKWLGQTQDQVTVAYASSFSIGLFPEPMEFLPLDLGVEVGEAVVVKRDYASHPRFRSLLLNLQQRSAALASQYDDISVEF